MFDACLFENIAVKSDARYCLTRKIVAEAKKSV